VSLPNIISLCRALAVPVIIFLILRANYAAAFWLFLVAGASDAVDGYLAKRMNQVSALGSTLDPLADKALLVSVYVVLGVQDRIDLLVVILVVFRDVLIIAGALLLFVFRGQRRMQPHMLSKINTGAQLLFATYVLAELAFRLDLGIVTQLFGYGVAVTTVLSGACYVAIWNRQMKSANGSA
jgi:cardiolipin synthase